MRLLVVTQYFWPENFRINELVAEFCERGHDVTILTGFPNYPDGAVFEEFRKNPEQYATFCGAHVVRVPMLARGRSAVQLLLNYLSFAVSASLLGLWKLRGEKFDAIFVYEPSPITVGLPGAVMRAVKRAPMAFWVLDLWPETLKAVGAVKSEWVLKLVGSMVAWIYRRCDLILAQSRSFMGNIARYAPERSWIEYFPAWADNVFRTNQLVEPAAEIPLSPDVFTIMFAGNIGEAQDFPAILAAAEMLRDRDDIRWVIVGDGRMSSWVFSQIQQQQLESNVLMVGRYPIERMPAFFAHADALLVSLRAEPIFAMTIPGKMQAYFGAGIPVLAMLDGEGANIVAEADAGLVSPAGSGAALAQNVVKLAALSKQERVRMGENGRRFCDEQFDQSALVNRLEVWLQEMVSPREGKRGEQ